ncbi:MAG: sigma-70 family RNA polymerase sigma factor [Kiritimatiellae bacterium]|nr:sigma-70 family RNA polymerase sigma factor [Kiritimatiellia bacterium]
MPAEERDFQESYEQAFRQVIAHRTMLKAYIQAIVRDPVLAEDTLSDVTIEIARSWARYDPARPFPNWARGVARRVALNALRGLGKRPATLDPEVLEAVGSEIDACGGEARLESRKRLLRRCVAQLSEPNRRLVQLRYFENQTYEQIADAVRRSVNALYVAFNRIHEALSRCIRENLEST